MNRSLSILLVFALLSTVLGPGCASTAPSVAPPTVGAPSEINAPFRNADLDPALWTKRFEGESREVFRARAEITAALALRPGDVVADVGAGTGLFVPYFSQAVGDEGRVLALDIAPKFVDLVTSRAAKMGLRNVEARLSEQDDVGVREGRADVVYVCDTYHHFENPAAILQTIFAALKPGGRFIVIDYHRIEGKTRPFLMRHVRAPMETFSAEIQAAGFVPLPAPPTPFLDENYLLIFERP